MLERPASPGPRAEPPRGRRSGTLVGTLPVAAVTAAVWAAGVGLLVVGAVVTLVWAVSARGDDGISTPAQAAGVVWLAAHHAPVETATATVTLLPVVLLALVLLLLVRAGRWAARITLTSTLPDVVLLVVAGTATYSCIAVLVAEVSDIAGAQVPPLPAVCWAALVSVVGLGTGVVRESGLAAGLLDRLPVQVRAAGPVALATAAVLAVAVGVLAVVAVAMHWSTITAMSHQLAPSAGDAVGLVLVQLLYLPNLLVWVLGYLAGPGFAVGGGATVDPFSATGALLPGVPVLGAIPLDAPAAAPFLLLVPVLAGIVGTVVLRRRHEWHVRDESLVVLTSAALVGLGTAVLCLLAAGSLGDARLADLGPTAWSTALAVSGLVAAGGLLTTFGAHLRPLVWAPDDL
jgi:hypothetical protein